MYKVASDRRQTSLHRGRLTDWVNGQERLKPADKLKQLQDGVKILQARIDAAVGDEKARLGQEKFAMQCEITAVRKLLKREQTLEWKSFFINEAKRILSDSQFELIYRAAIRECEACAKRREDDAAAVEASLHTEVQS